MGRNILDLEFDDGSLMIEDPDFGTPLMFIHEQTKNLPDKEFYKWIAELHFLRLTDEKGKQLDEFTRKFARTMNLNFMEMLHILSQHLYIDHYRDECNKVVDANDLEERMQDIIRAEMAAMRKIHFGK